MIFPKKLFKKVSELSFKTVLIIFLYMNDDIFKKKLKKFIKSDTFLYKTIILIKKSVSSYNHIIRNINPFNHKYHHFNFNTKNHKIYSSMMKGLIAYNRKSLSNFNESLNKFSLDIIIHSINNKNELLKTIESINVAKRFLNISTTISFLGLSKQNSYGIHFPTFDNQHKTKKNNFLFFISSGSQIQDYFFVDVYKLLYRENFKASLIYFNEIDLKSKKYISKPIFSPDFLENVNYIGTNFIVKDCLKKQLDVIINENNFYKFLLMVASSVPSAQIFLINKYLIKRYSSSHKNNFNYIKDAIKSYHENLNINADITIKNKLPLIKYKNFNPLITIIIPAAGQLKNNKDLLLGLLKSIKYKTKYTNYEIIVIDHDDLGVIHEKYFKKHSNIFRVKLNKLSNKNNFNFSKNCNTAAKYAHGEYLLFLNDDMEVISTSWLSDLIGHFLKNHTGVVGGRLIFQNNRLQHSGVGLLNISPGHIYENLPYSYFDANITKNLLAVTGACLMISKKDFDLVGGFDEGIFKTNYSDTDLCLKVIFQLKKYVIYEPKCLLYHFASISRTDSDIVPEDVLIAFHNKYGFLGYDKFINSVTLGSLHDLKPIKGKVVKYSY